MHRGFKDKGSPCKGDYYLRVFEYIADLLIFVCGFLELFVCGFLWITETTGVRWRHSGAVLWPETGGIRKNGDFMYISGQAEPAPEAPEGLAVMSVYGGSEKWLIANR